MRSTLSGTLWKDYPSGQQKSIGLFRLVSSLNGDRLGFSLEEQCKKKKKKRKGQKGYCCKKRAALSLSEPHPKVKFCDFQGFVEGTSLGCQKTHQYSGNGILKGFQKIQCRLGWQGFGKNLGR